MSKKVMVLVGTQKGGFIFESNEKRKRWKVNDIQFKSWNVMHLQMDPRDRRLHAATSLAAEAAAPASKAEAPTE